VIFVNVHPVMLVIIVPLIIPGGRLTRSSLSHVCNLGLVTQSQLIHLFTVLLDKVHAPNAQFVEQMQ
jgi:hypothetical protein